MSLYALLNSDGVAIAYHRNKKIIKRYMESTKRSDYCMVVKVKHNKEVSLENSGELNDLYLVRSGGGYIPNYLFDSASILIEEELFNYETLLSVIERELISFDINKHNRKALERTYVYFNKRLDKIKHDQPDVNSVKKFNDMRSEYLSKI